MSEEEKFAMLFSSEPAKEILEKPEFDLDLLLIGGRIQEDDGAGVELIKFAREKRPGLKIILMSMNYTGEQAKAAGADDHWETSPSHFDELLQKIKGLFA